MSWITAADSHIGGRGEQQDRFLVEHSEDRSCHLLVVADGAGGHKTGAVAAQTAIDCIRESLDSVWSSRDPGAFLGNLIIECNERVTAIAGNDLACTTLVLVFIKGDELFWTHAGDSRFYLIRDGEVLVKTTDHSVIELQRQQVAQGDDAAVNVASNKLYMCLGAPTSFVPDVASSLAREGDTLLLCSDGLWGQVDMEQAIAELGDKPPTTVTLRRWTERASESKLENSDNITLVAANFTSQSGFLSCALKVLKNMFN